MAPNFKKSPLQRPKKTHWFLGWLGIPFRATSSKKASNSGGRPKRLFKLCMPKIKVIIVRKKKVSFDSKIDYYKASKSMMVDATNKVKHVKVKHASTIQELNIQPKGFNDQHEYKSPTDQSNTTTKYREQKPSPTIEKSIDNKVVKDSFVGVSIMVITLIIMSIWGRLCAILCMSVWLYCVSLLRACRDASPNLDNVKKDVASKLYKTTTNKRKRVTLEGLFQLDRDTKIGAS
ncbi:hypothetical protein KSS87_002595 [Heliosperma pusillum]|nr:hypothetical protein KSS87_002595 [Heliosperma pusillum]